jgi:hypothetical protein
MTMATVPIGSIERVGRPRCLTLDHRGLVIDGTGRRSSLALSSSGA